MFIFRNFLDSLVIYADSIRFNRMLDYCYMMDNNIKFYMAKDYTIKEV